jgi:hypothetical protein
MDGRQGLPTLLSQFDNVVLVLGFLIADMAWQSLLHKQVTDWNIVFKKVSPSRVDLKSFGSEKILEAQGASFVTPELKEQWDRMNQAQRSVKNRTTSSSDVSQCENRLMDTWYRNSDITDTVTTDSRDDSTPYY